MAVSPSICFVIPYFGRWPFWMPLFLESCRLNSDIDWLLFSDCGEPEHLPPNVRIEPIDYASYCAWVSQRLGIPFAPANPYKLCDLKPALGYIHEDRLRGYDFWAFGDLDVLYGRLREYFTPSDWRAMTFIPLTLVAFRAIYACCATPQRCVKFSCKCRNGRSD